MAKHRPNLFLNLPETELKFSKEDEIIKVFDRLRRKYVALTPEEYVRQYFVDWLINHLNYPESLMANEVTIDVNGTDKRCDTVVFKPTGEPLIIVEYKSPNINISQETFDQIARYNSILKAEYLIVSNGLNHYCCKMDYKNNSYNFIPEIPLYTDINTGHSLN